MINEPADDLVETGYLCATCLEIVDYATSDGPRDCPRCERLADDNAEATEIAEEDIPW